MEKLFDEDFQLYASWYMNFVEFMYWLHDEYDELGRDEFDEKYPSFSASYAAYLKMLNAEEKALI